MRRKGDILLGYTVMFGAAFLALIFLWSWGQAATEEVISGIPFLGDREGGNDLELKVGQTTELRETDRRIHYFLNQSYNDRYSVQEAVQRYLYCKATSRSGCSIEESRLATIADNIIPNRVYQLEIRYRDVDKIVIKSHSTTNFNTGPTAYAAPLPMPGGTTAQILLNVDGAPRKRVWIQ